MQIENMLTSGTHKSVQSSTFSLWLPSAHFDPCVPGRQKEHSQYLGFPSVFPSILLPIQFYDYLLPLLRQLSLNSSRKLSCLRQLHFMFSYQSLCSSFIFQTLSTFIPSLRSGRKQRFYTIFLGFRSLLEMQP